MQLRLPGSSRILFLSDVHLGAFSKAKNEQLEQELIQLIDFAEQHHYQIAVLGDLFDYWIEYPGKVPELGKPLLQRFKAFHRHSPGSLFITGNHDNWTLGHFEACGFEVEPDYRLLTISDTNVLLMHGDALGAQPEELKRPLLHRFIRNKTFLKFYRTIFSPETGLNVMKKFSKFSRKLGSEESDPDRLDKGVQKILQNTDIDVILCGHDHRPRRKNFDEGTYLNLGTFHHHHTLVEYNNQCFSLVQWKSKQNKLISFNSTSTT